jgi:hypothetical protein
MIHKRSTVIGERVALEMLVCVWTRLYLLLLYYGQEEYCTEWYYQWFWINNIV